MKLKLPQIPKKMVLPVTVVVLVVVLVLVYLSIRTRQRKKKEVDLIRTIISTGVGQDGKDLGSVLVGVKPAANFDPRPAAEQIYGAKGFFNDDEEAVYEALGGLYREQIAAVNTYFVQRYGLTLDAFLKSFLSGTEYQRVQSILDHSYSA
ncbi:hypothetical protein SAMN05421823_11966 [Catalinimonas alkaloidigena]|uniref:Annexin n=1 Tax=Catalinimonas alkaloidigena TaxID=1075417 RepID=A0A1G9VAF3_9BACT|nr:hypothetical protein [Catalinimonas alkaloidigena]SDM69036.1 hypothetical protein SAMN05421823_11966 [Catalinimonas alkaloidigena]